MKLIAAQAQFQGSRARNTINTTHPAVTATLHVIPATLHVIPATFSVIPAKAGIQCLLVLQHGVQA